MNNLGGESPPFFGETTMTLHFTHPGLETVLNRITHADCITALRQLPDASVDLILTDPPYIVHYRDRGGRTIPNDDNGRWVFPALRIV